MIVVLRHATAGKAAKWKEDDRLRPLDERGRRRAELVAETLQQLGVRRIVSSPYLRCVQTVEPLARRLGVPIELAEELAEGTPRRRAAAFIAAAGDGVVHCTHGDVAAELLGRPLRKGVAIALDSELVSVDAR